MFWRFFVKDVPLLDSALEGIVFKEGKGRFYGRFRKKRLLAYDEVAKCLRYYTPERALKGTIYLHDIFIGEALVEMSGRIACLRSQYLEDIRDTKKWIGILSRELDTLKIRDRIQLNNGNLVEGTFSKTLKPNSAILNSLRIGDHREHEECCFLFDEEHQHKVIALESLCSLQAMKIYELSHSVQKFQKKCDDMEVPPSEEIKKVKDQYNKLRVSYELEKLRVLDLKAQIEEEEEKKVKEITKNEVKKVDRHGHVLDVGQVKVMTIEKGESSSKLIGSQKKNIPTSPNNFVNYPNYDKNKMEEIRKLQEELEITKTLLAQEKARALDSPISFNPSPSPSPLSFERSTGTPPNRSPLVPTRNMTPSNLGNSGRLAPIPESIPNNPKIGTSSYRPNSPGIFTNAYIEHHYSNINPTRDASPKLSTHPPSSPQMQRAGFRQNSEPSQIVSPQPLYPQQPTFIDTSAVHPATPIPTPTNPPTIPLTISRSSNHKDLLDFNIQSSLSLDISSENSAKHNGLRNSNGISPKEHEDTNGASSVSATATTSLKSSKIFNLRQEDNLAPKTKLRSVSDVGTSSPFRMAKPNGKLTTSDNGSSFPAEMTVSPRSRTNSNPPPFKSNSATGNSKIGWELAELLKNSHPDDNGWAVQVIPKLTEAVAEITNLFSQLQDERDKVKGLMEEKDHMLEWMEEMKEERTKNLKYRGDMDELMVAKDGQIRSMQATLDTESRQRKEAEARLNQLLAAQINLNQQTSLLDDETQSHQPEILQPLLTNHIH